VHATALGQRECLNIGENVTFSIEENPRSGKLRAIEVTGDETGTPPDMSGGGRDRGRGGRGGRGGNRDRDRGYGGGYGDRGSRGGGYGGRGGGYGGEKKVCFKFQEGNCSFGDRCRFSHES